MRDVAERAGVGMMTVSRVLNGTAQVREETKERVYRALEELHYRPNLMARALRGFGTRSIGVILPYLYDPFFASCAHAISSVAKQHAYSVLLATSDENTETETEQLRDLLRHRVEGIIVIPASSGRSHLTDPEFNGTPMVALDRPIVRPIPGAPVDRVLVENQQGATLAIEHLIQHGHRRICFIASRAKSSPCRRASTAIRRPCRPPASSPSASTTAATKPPRSSFVRTVRARPNPPTAIFAGQRPLHSPRPPRHRRARHPHPGRDGLHRLR